MIFMAIWLVHFYAIQNRCQGSSTSSQKGKTSCLYLEIDGDEVELSDGNEEDMPGNIQLTVVHESEHSKICLQQT